MASKNWSLENLKDKGLVFKDGKLVPVKSLVDPKPKKFNVVEKLLEIDAKELKANKKIIGATKTIVAGITFDSKLEAYFYGLLKASGEEFIHQQVFILQPVFKYNGETIRAIKSYVDFYLPVKNIIIDTKGYANDVAPIKYKMLKYTLTQTGLLSLPKIFMPKNKAECDVLLNRLLYEL